MAVTETSANKPSIRIEIAPRTVLVLLGVVVGVWLLARLTNVIAVVMFALVLVGAIEPLVAWVQRHGAPRGRALVVVFTGVALGLAAMILLMILELLIENHQRDGILGALFALLIAAGIQMLVRELRVDLPGETPAPSELIQQGVHASEVYADLTAGTTASEAVVIAAEVATLVKKGEDIPDVPPDKP